MNQDVDWKRKCGPASAMRIKADILESIGCYLAVEIMRSHGIMNLTEMAVSHFLEYAL